MSLSAGQSTGHSERFGFAQALPAFLVIALSAYPACTLDHEAYSFDSGTDDLPLQPEDVPVTPSCSTDQLLCGHKCVSIDDPQHCGRCDHDCTALAGVNPSTIGCSDGECKPETACLPGFAHCSNRSNDGCETNITKPNHCGSCTTVCTEPTPLCSIVSGTSKYACQSGCTPGATRCDGTCTFVDSDPHNCGQCGNECKTPVGGSVSCIQGKCAQLCPANTHLCGDSCASNNSVSSCGLSCIACDWPSDSTPTCNGVECDFLCNQGYMRSGSRCVPACGNHMLDPGETCDDGNRVSGDGCSPTCTLEGVPSNGCLSPSRPVVLRIGLGSATYRGDTSTVTLSKFDCANVTLGYGPDLVYTVIPVLPGRLQITLVPEGNKWDAVLNVRWGQCASGIAAMPIVCTGSRPIGYASTTLIVTNEQVRTQQAVSIIVDGSFPKASGPYTLTLTLSQ